MFGDIIDIQIKSLQGIKISILKKSPQWIFAKGLTHDFGKKKKMGNSCSSFFMSKYAQK